MRRLSWLLGAIVLLLLLGGDFTYWRMTVWQLRRGLDLWEANARAEGWEIASGPVSAAGWPLTAALNVPNLTLRHDHATIPAGMDLAAPAVSLNVSLLWPTALRVLVSSPVHVMWDGSPDIILTGQTMTISTALRQGGAAPMVFRAEDLRIDPANGSWHAMAERVRGEVAAQPPRAINGRMSPVTDFAIDAQAITLPSTVKWALGPSIADCRMQGSLRGPVPAGTPITQAAQAWRDGGGSLELGQYALHWGPLSLSGSATMALDGLLQPMGTGTAHVVGYGDTLDRLAASGVLTRPAATAAKAVLSLIATGGEGDAPATIDVPLTLQYRTLSIRQIPLVQLPELDWPASR